MVDSPRCPTYLLDDAPANEDAFGSPKASGPHRRVADAIVDLIHTTDGGKVIGLEGGWGSGKSTVISILCSLLKDDPDYAVISFDAWAHEGDPLRRTYLETLINSLQDREWIDKGRWGDRKEELARRRKVTKTTVLPETTWLGTVFAISIFFVPIGSALLSSALNDGMTLGLDLPFFWKGIVGAVFSLAPIIVLLLRCLDLYLWRLIIYSYLLRPIYLRLPRALRQIVQKIGDTNAGRTGERSSDWGFVVKKGASRTHTESIETPDPTSLEFQESFRDLMHDALESDGNHRVLLVLDNLDRVDAENARAIWSTLQTFLHNGCRPAGEKWPNRLWVVVPYDPKGIRRLWAEPEDPPKSTDSKTDGEGGKPNSQGHKKAALAPQSVADSFLDKSFQVRFQVPPPVLSDWKGFLVDQVRKALPDHSDEATLIYRVYDRFRDRSDNTPTPRELKLYVNQIGALHRQWQHEFPLGHMAYYVLKFSQKGCDANLLIASLGKNDEIPERAAEQLLDEPDKPLRQSIAGLVFNVEAKKGMTLLLEEPIRKALVAADHKLLVSLKNFDAGFWAVLDNLMFTGAASPDRASILATACCLKESRLLENSKQAEVPSIRENLRKAAQDVEDWQALNGETTPGLAALCQLTGNADFTRHIMEKMAEIASKPIKADSDSVAKHICSLIEVAMDLGHADACPECFELTPDPDAWSHECQYLAMKDPHRRFWSRFRPQCELDAISQSVAQHITAGTFSQEHINTFLVSTTVFGRPSWQEALTAFSERLAVDSGADVEKARILLRGLCTLVQLDAPNAIPTMNELANGGHLLQILRLASEEQHTECECLCAFAFLLGRPDAAKPDVPVVTDASGKADPSASQIETGYQRLTELLESNDEDHAKRLVHVLRQYEQSELIWKIVDGRGKYDPLLSHCLRRLADDEHSHEFFTSSVVLERWKELRAALNTEDNPDGFSKLLAETVDKNGLRERLRNSDKGFRHDEASLYLTIAENVPDNETGFLDWCKKGLEQLTAENWNVDFTSGFACVGLTVYLVEHDRKPEFSTPLEDALVAYAEQLLQGQNAPDDKIARKWRVLLDCFAESGMRSALQRRLLEKAVKRKGKAHANFFALYGHEIADREILYARDGVVVDFFSPMVQDRNVAGLKWLRHFLNANPDFLDGIDEGHVKEFDGRLKACVSSPENDEAQSIIEEMASLRGVIREEEADTEDTDTREPIADEADVTDNDEVSA